MGMKLLKGHEETFGFYCFAAVEAGSAKHLLRQKIANQLKGLILAQNERWRRGLGMQVEREVYFGKWTAAKGTVMCRYLPSDLG